MSFFFRWKQVARGKSVTRIAMNEALASMGMWSGKVLDVGGTNVPVPSYRGCFKMAPDATVTTVNLDADAKPDLLANASAIPAPDAAFDALWCLNLLEHVPDPARVAAEMARVAKSGARLVVVTPFLVRIHAHPFDFHRFTPLALENLLAAAGFGEVQARTLGGGPWMAAFAQLQGTVPKALLVLAFPFFALLDKVVLWRRPAWRGTWPLCVIADAKKL
jgi:SAM-dependent methyltransferase